jgi:hypothetical protein
MHVADLISGVFSSCSKILCFTDARIDQLKEVKDSSPVESGRAPEGSARRSSEHWGDSIIILRRTVIACTTKTIRSLRELNGRCRHGQVQCGPTVVMRD